ncbi:MAG: transcription-repair coupling factor [Firmicutes bacterium]|nr:transcription-repair coupling factor [Bacillota bacterium]
MDALTKQILSHPAYAALKSHISEKITPVLLTGVVGVAEALFVSAYSADENIPLIYAAETPAAAGKLFEELRALNANVYFYPAHEVSDYFAEFAGKEAEFLRLSALRALLCQSSPIIILSAEALLQKTCTPEALLDAGFELFPGDILPPDELIKKLVSGGYERSHAVEGAGQFAVRGGIVDIFPFGEDAPARLEYWDDEIDSIRLLDAASLRSVDKLEQLSVFPVTEKLGEAIPLLDFFPEDAVIFFGEPTRAKESIEQFCEDFASAKELGEKSSNLSAERLGGLSCALISPEELYSGLNSQKTAVFSALGSRAPGFDIKVKISADIRSVPPYRYRTELFLKELRSLTGKYTVFVLSKDEGNLRRLTDSLLDAGIDAAYITDPEKLKAVPGGIYASVGRIAHGFISDAIKLAVFAESDFAGERKQPKKRSQSSRKNKNRRAIDSFSELAPGDYVVHDTYGIGIFNGVESISVDGISKDYLKISYAAGGGLFVPVSQMDLIQKYIGSEGAAPRLSKLGGGDWERARNKARKTIAILAQDLLDIYAKREAAEAFRYSPDTPWQKELEDSFPYEETEDQLAAIADIKRDMEGERTMDRLLCGDVGYGKTEVALRAAFKAVQDGRQVAVMAPTTLLSEQHYTTFRSRMEAFPVRIDVLNRFRSAKEQKETLTALKSGECDIVIGTHRLLSKDVSFKSLGMIIIDEEQRFGVGHKEKLKALKADVDVLSLSATPIPRTLHMSLSGIRDMSILDEPPRDRMPVQTYVCEQDNFIIQNAIRKELSRGGQVYYLHNRISDISRLAAQLRALVPEARISYAHGRMAQTELEEIMQEFMAGETDVLLCTTIIENGIDIPNVNTIIVQDADRLGLSQLYQLRGRVGRSNKQAYAWFLYRRDKALSEESEKRLRTIREFTQFGAGFKVAMKDMQIRGAGSLLGAEQHGSLGLVGYDMYCKLLKEAVDVLRGAPPAPKEYETSIDLSVNAFLPKHYIAREEERLNVYKRLSLIESREDYFDAQEELEDKYGDPPRAAQRLLELILAKAAAKRAGIISAAEKNGKIIIKFSPDTKIEPEKLFSIIMKNPKKYSLNPKESSELRINLPERPISPKVKKHAEDSLDIFIGLLSELGVWE